MDVNNIWDVTTFSHVKIKIALLMSYLGKDSKGMSTEKHSNTVFTKPTPFQNAALRMKGVGRSSLPGSYMQLQGKCHHSLLSDNKIM